VHLTIPRSTHGAAAVARAVALISLAILAGVGTARADEQTLDTLGAPIVRVNVRAGDVTIRTWDRPSVQIDADSSLQIIRRNARQADTSLALPIPPFTDNANPAAELPPESFVVSIAPGDHETSLSGIRRTPRSADRRRSPSSCRATPHSSSREPATAGSTYAIIGAVRSSDSWGAAACS